MKQISVLDCTLRDGGYINNFEFGYSTISNLISGFSKASIDIVECGFLRSCVYDKNSTIFPSIEAISDHINVTQQTDSTTLFVAMIQYGAIPIEQISKCDNKTICGIRLTFHEHELDDALRFAYELKDKGYKVFVQPVGTTTYSDPALLDLIEKVNKLEPYAFYIVDTLGKLYKKDLIHLFYLVHHNLDPNISIGFHSHNNLQLSFSNAQELSEQNLNRKLIIDSSLMGMGRGAGNLNTELLVNYLNENHDTHYDIIRILNLMDQYIKPLSLCYKWGYSAAFYLAAIENCHPNYASYLIEKQTLQLRDIDCILKQLSPDRRTLFDKNYVSEIYSKYLEISINDNDTISLLKTKFTNKDILILAPGKSIEDNYLKIIDYINSHKNLMVMAINFNPEKIPVDLIFVSNLKRWEGIRSVLNDIKADVIVTSNIRTQSNKVLRINYSSYLCDIPSIKDNAGIMCINLLIAIGVNKCVLAGFDGFQDNPIKNYCSNSLYLDVDYQTVSVINRDLYNKFNNFKNIQLEFLKEF